MAARSLTSRVHVDTLQPALREESAVLPVSLDQGSRLDRPLYALLNTDGAVCAGRVWQGDCILLFTSQAAADAFADMTGVEAGLSLIFSRSRTEFLMQAGRSSGQGFIGALIDLTLGTREAAFVGFRVDRRQQNRSRDRLVE